MNPIHIVEAVRPDIAPINPLERNHLRERLFDLDAGARPSGLPLETVDPKPKSNNALRLAALAGIGLIGVAGLAFSASQDESPEADSTPTTVFGDVVTSSAPTESIVATAPTIAPTTTTPPIAGTDETPLLLPVERSRLDDLSYQRMALGGSTALLRAPDLTTFVLVEADGVRYEPPSQVDEDPDDEIVPVPLRTVGNVEAATPQADGRRTYDITVPCGSLSVHDIGTALEYRGELIELLESTSLENGSIDIELPATWGVIDISRAADRFELGIPVFLSNGTSGNVTLVQYPGATIAAAATPGNQYGPATFFGQSAWLSRDPEQPDRIEVLGRFGTTAYSIGASGLALNELEAAMTTLIPGSVDDWIQRFGVLGGGTDEDIRTCSQQPSFNIATG